MKILKSLNKVMKLLKPPPKLTLSEWSDIYRMLTSESSAEAGRWQTSRAPYQKEIMDAVSNPEVEKVVVMSSSQVGKTEIILNIIGYYIDYMPCPMMLVMPIEEMLKSFSKDRLAPMINATPTLRNKVFDVKSKDSSNTMLHKKFHGGHLTLVGANSAANLASRPIRVLLADEVDRFPEDVGGEGDPLKLAEKRTTTFWNRKLVYVSTPTIAGVSRIEKEFKNATMEEWSLRCPDCGEYQILKFTLLDFETLEMTCEHCGAMHNEKKWKSKPGKWIQTNEEYIGKNRSFHLNEMASPWKNWGEIRDDFLQAKNDVEMLKTFVNTSLGEVWEEKGEITDYKVVANRAETYEAEVPDNVLVLTAGVDVQDDRIEVEVLGQGLQGETWGIEYKKIMGDPSKNGAWDLLDVYLKKRFKYKDGNYLTVTSTFIDSGNGQHTNDVYRFCADKADRWIYPIKGRGGIGVPLVAGPTKPKGKNVNLFTVGDDTGKSMVLSRLKIDKPGENYCHFPDDPERGYIIEYFKGLLSEKKITKEVKGKQVVEWKVIYKRNEPLDCRKYALAAFDILPVSLEQLAENNFLRNREVKEKSLGEKKVTKKRLVSKGVVI